MNLNILQKIGDSGPVDPWISQTLDNAKGKRQDREAGAELLEPAKNQEVKYHEEHGDGRLQKRQRNPEINGSKQRLYN